jgi:hypothetical protein
MSPAGKKTRGTVADKAGFESRGDCRPSARDACSARRMAFNRRIGSHDQDTGEILEGVAVWIGRKLASPYGRQWMQVNQDALAEIAADRDMGLEAWRVFAYLNSRLDFENLILVPQTEMATALTMKRPLVSRAVKLLTDKEIILRGPKMGSVSSYRLNPHYGWKSKVQNLHQARQKPLQLVEAGENPVTPRPSPTRRPKASWRPSRNTWRPPACRAGQGRGVFKPSDGTWLQAPISRDIFVRRLLARFYGAFLCNLLARFYEKNCLLPNISYIQLR